jgi:hypothetical protein
VSSHAGFGDRRQRSSRGVLFGILIVGQFSCAEKGIAADWARIGSEFLVNSHTSSFQAQSQVSVAGDGKFVVAWESNVQDGSGSGVAVRGFDMYGVASEPDRIINETTDGQQGRPAIATLANAGVVVAWENVMSGALPDVRIRVLSDALVPVGSEILVGEPGVGNDYGPSLTASADGGFLLLWERYNPLTESDVLARFYEANGVPRTPEFRINEYATGLQRFGTAAPLPSGDFIVVWGGDGQDGSRFGAFARRISTQGDLLGTEFPINTYTPGPQIPSRVRTNTAGDFVVVWEGGGESEEDNDGGIFARRFNKDGIALTPQILVNSFTRGPQSRPDLAIASNNGEFVVTWVSYDGYFTDDGERDLNIRAQVFDADGARVGTEFRVNVETLNFQGFPSVDGTPDGRFVVTWDSDYHDGSSTGVVAQRLVLNPICGDANADRNTSATDALLVLGAAVGIVSCAPCMCDSNDSGLITATDALLALQSALGQMVTLSCPVCS